MLPDLGSLFCCYFQPGDRRLLETGLEAYEVGNYAAALDVWRPAAEAGSTEAINKRMNCSGVVQRRPAQKEVDLRLDREGASFSSRAARLSAPFVPIRTVGRMARHLP